MLKNKYYSHLLIFTTHKKSGRALCAVMSPGSGQVGIFYKQTEINKDRSCENNVVEWLDKEEYVRRYVDRLACLFIIYSGLSTKDKHHSVVFAVSAA